MVTDWKSRLGEEIAKGRRRHAAHMTQEQLAESAGLSRNTIGHYERGERAPDFEELRKIAEILGIDHFDAADNMRIEFSSNGRRRLEPVAQQLTLDLDEDQGVSVRIERTNHELIIKKAAS